VAFGLRTHHGDLNVIIGDGTFYVSNVGDIVVVRELLVSFMHPVGPVGIVGDDHRIETRVRRHPDGDIVVFDDA
jgi:hypothetical protein